MKTLVFTAMLMLAVAALAVGDGIPVPQPGEKVVKNYYIIKKYGSGISRKDFRALGREVRNNRTNISVEKQRNDQQDAILSNHEGRIESLEAEKTMQARQARERSTNMENGISWGPVIVTAIVAFAIVLVIIAVNWITKLFEVQMQTARTQHSQNSGQALGATMNSMNRAAGEVAKVTLPDGSMAQVGPPTAPYVPQYAQPAAGITMVPAPAPGHEVTVSHRALNPGGH